MQIIKSFAKLFVFICPFFATAQSTYLPEGNKIYHFMDRMEIKHQTNTEFNFSSIKPYSRKNVVNQAEFINNGKTTLSKVDAYNLQSIYMNNSEWYTGDKKAFLSKTPVLKHFYVTKSNLYEVDNKDFYLSINPVLGFQFAKEQDNIQKLFVSTRGVTVRGLIAKKIGFSTTITDNQERGPSFFDAKVNQLRAVPGNGFYKPFKGTGVDYFDARGYITVNAAKYVDIQFGYDKNFIGNGYRSLFLSDWGNSNLFLKLNTKIWKLNYQNLFMELMPQFDKITGDQLLDRKYAAMHHLSINVSKGVNIGLFEGIIFGRKNRFDFQYLNPIIFLRHIEGTIGSPDNAIAGFDFKANALHSLQFYGQFLLDEFKLSKIREGNGWWANKWGLQLGAKYIDAFGISNLDIQVETNRVRPYTYSHGDSISNYTHYNQPLAHPLGANFQEFIGIVKYQPAPKWYITARTIYYKQGLDSAYYNSGSNIFRSNSASERKDINGNVIDDGYTLGGGKKAVCLNGILQLAYELRENLFFDLSLQYRNYKLDNVSTSSTIVSAGVRLNIFQREYNY
ncbi:hypothetical protein LK994_02385 [Ferruginibacter lapsinanis]|uniref:hypothetical protein n=1 Tax=Ferruginibacter lapsinanis TaxID=563172 RepID=UPI001E4F2591|nr:hypothetical protein [Ferruginibacter lapsinanis]UEG50322.1 hypothetical protein LK994_02385 [Ferruginibacter lapsinanis]